MPIERPEMDHEPACLLRFLPFLVGFLPRLRFEISAADSVRCVVDALRATVGIRFAKWPVAAGVLQFPERRCAWSGLKTQSRQQFRLARTMQRAVALLFPGSC